MATESQGWETLNQASGHASSADAGPSSAGEHATASDHVGPQAATEEMHSHIMTAQQVANAASRVMDMKQLCAPPSFDGAENKWAEWRCHMDSLFVLVGISKSTTWAVQASPLEIEMSLLPKEYEGISVFLHAILSQLCSGKALTIVRLCADNNGLRAWRHLVREYEPKQALRWTTMLTSLLNPKWVENDDFQGQWLEWERKTDVYERQAGAHLPDDIKAAVVLEHAPKTVREFLEQSPVDCTESYMAMKTQLRLFFLRKRRFDDAGQLRAGNAGMSIDELVAWIKGKDKGGGGKGKPWQLQGGKGKAQDGGKGAKGAWKSKGKGKGGGQQQQPWGQQQPTQWNQPQQWQPQPWAQQQQKPQAGGKGKGSKGKGKEKGSGKAQHKGATPGTRFEGYCNSCGKYGHKMKECWSKPVGELNDNDGTNDFDGLGVSVWPGTMDLGGTEDLSLLDIEPGPKRLKSITNDAITGEMVIEQLDGKSYVMVMVVSGAFEHVCPMSFGHGLQVSAPREISTASGQPIEHFGMRVLTMMAWGSIPTTARFEVCGVRKPILSVGSLMNAGIGVHFDHQKGELIAKGHKCPLVRRGNLFYMPVKLNEARSANALVPMAIGTDSDNSSTSGSDHDEVKVVQRTPVYPECFMKTVAWMSKLRSRPVLVEYCCEPDSKLSNIWMQGRGGALRLGLPDFDLRRDSVIRQVIFMIRSYVRGGQQVLVWCSLPCQPWTAWQNLNQGPNTSNETKLNLTRARAESKVMQHQLLRIIKTFANDDVEFAFEWPQYCSGWQQDSMKEILSALPLTSLFNG
jgi:hypothetical protein